MSSVDHPSHYRADTGFEAIDVIEAWKLGFALGNVVKYLSRAGLKVSDPLSPMSVKEKAVEDLEKARWYLDREIARLKKESDDWMDMEMEIEPNPELAKLLGGVSDDPVPPVPQALSTKLPDPSPQGERVQLPRPSVPFDMDQVRRPRGDEMGDGRGSPCRLS